MQDIENEEYLDKTKYFLDPNKNKIYATKGSSGHKGLAYKILQDINLNFLYSSMYEDRISAPEFLTYLGYVWVDEKQEDYEITFEDCKTINYAMVAYCSKVIDEEYIKYLENTYNGEKDMVVDFYKVEQRKAMIDKVVETVRQMKKNIETENNIDDAR